MSEVILDGVLSIQVNLDGKAMLVQHWQPESALHTANCQFISARTEDGKLLTLSAIYTGRVHRVSEQEDVDELPEPTVLQRLERIEKKVGI